MPFILGVRVDAVKKGELELKLKSFLAEDRLQKVFTPNAEIILEAHRDQNFRACLNSGDLNIADGVSVLFASRFLRFLKTKSHQELNTKVAQKIENRVPGVEVLLLLCKIATEEGKSVLFYGAGAGVAEKAAGVMRKVFVGLDVKGLDPGVVDLARTATWGGPNVDCDFAPDILAVALGHPKQEQFICSMAEEWPGVKIAIGVG